MTTPAPPATPPVPASTPLPHGWTDPLHVLEPSALDDAHSWLARALIVLALLAAWLWWRRRARRTSPVESVVPAAWVSTAEVSVGFVDELRRTFDGSGRYREGCHALAEALREHLSARTPWPLISRTAGEIAGVVRDPRIVQCFEQLTRLQYRRNPPGRRDFLAACDQAAAVASVSAPAPAPAAAPASARDATTPGRGTTRATKGGA